MCYFTIAEPLPNKPSIAATKAPNVNRVRLRMIAGLLGMRAFTCHLGVFNGRLPNPSQALLLLRLPAAGSRGVTYQSWQRRARFSGQRSSCAQVHRRRNRRVVCTEGDSAMMGSSSIARHGRSGRAYRAGFTLTKWPCRTADRTIRRECLHQIVAFGEADLRRILRSYALLQRGQNASIIG